MEFETLKTTPLLESYSNDYGTFFRPKIEYIFMLEAEMWSRRSTCIRRKVGCVFVDPKTNATVCAGYNGNYSNGPNQCDSLEPSLCGCTHSEISAISKSHQSLDGSVLYCTLGCCFACAKILINRKISKFIYLEDYRIMDGVELLKKNGIIVIKYSELA